MAADSKTDIAGAVSGAVATANQNTQGITMKQIVASLQEQEPVLTEYVQALEMRLVEVMAGFRVEYVNIGEMMMDGVAKGIEDGRSGVVNAVAKVIAAAVRRAKEDLDINSPSKVFAEIGGYMAAGLGEGWQKKMKVASDNISRSLTAVSAPPVMATAGAGVSNSRIYTYGDINIRIDSIKSEREARVLAQEIEFIRRQQDTGKGGGR